MQAALERLRSALPMDRAAIVITERWRGLLPSVQQGFPAGFLEAMEKSGAGDYICDLAYRRSGTSPCKVLARNDRTSAGGVDRDIRCVQEDPDRSGSPQLDRGQPADSGTQFRGNPVSPRRTQGVRFLRPQLMVGLALQLASRWKTMSSATTPMRPPRNMNC